MSAKKTAKKAEFINLLQNAFIARRDFCYANGLESQAKQLNSPIKSLSDAVVKAAGEVLTQTDLNTVANVIEQTDKKAGNYEQVKTLVKVADLVVSIAQGIKPRDNNMRITLAAMLKNGNRATVREILVAQSNAIRESGGVGSVRENFTVRSANYSAGTGSSQGSQTRQVLRILALADVQKGKRDDDAVLNEYGQAVIGKLFA